MAVIDLDILVESGVVNTANGVFMTNNKSDNDPRKALPFDSRQDALASIDQSTLFQRVEGLRLPVRENGNIVEYIFDGGITDDDFVFAVQGLIEKNPPISGVFNIDLSRNAGVDYSGSTTSLTNLDIAPGSVLGSFAKVKGDWATKPIFNNATEVNNSLFLPNVILYLYVEKWADRIIYWYTIE